MASTNLEVLIVEQAALIAAQMNAIAQSASSEEDVRHECNKLIEDFLQKAGLQITGHHGFDPKNSTHKTLANLSKRCHEAAAKGLTDTVTKLEAEIDQAAAELWGITNKELKPIQEALREVEKSHHEKLGEDDNDA